MKPTLSLLPPAWGGPFVWTTNPKTGNLVLGKLTPKAAAMLRRAGR